MNDEGRKTPEELLPDEEWENMLGGVEPEDIDHDWQLVPAALILFVLFRALLRFIF